MTRVLKTYEWNEPKNVSDVIKDNEDHGTFSREEVTILSGSGVLNIGAVLGQITVGAAASAAKAGGNTGDGTLTLDAVTPVLAGAKSGVYTVRCIAAAANGGVFRVENPDGFVLGDVAVGATFADDVKFAIADGAADFVVGDGWDITVALGSLKYAPFDPAGKDGRQTPSAVLIQKVDATAADVTNAIVVARECEVSAAGLEWLNTVTDDQKAAAIRHLKTLGIVPRSGA